MNLPRFNPNDNIDFEVPEDEAELQRLDEEQKEHQKFKKALESVRDRLSKIEYEKIDHKLSGFK